jgi:DNA-directed RNA polymerase II subunit RPB2
MDTENISWKLIDKYFKDNPNCLVQHHLESFNDFFRNGIKRIFYENNPIRFIEREEEGSEANKRNECLLYLGGRDGNRIYYGKPVIYDDNNSHYMFPNDARLRNMTYGITIHYDVDVEFIYYKDDEKQTHNMALEKIYLGRFPIMLQSDLCILHKMNKEVRFNAGECRNDYGGYFIIDGKEKIVIPQEKFADNMLYIRSNKDDDIYSHSAEIRSVSEDSSKPIRTTSVKIVAPSPTYSNNQIVVSIPNVKKPVPLFILMRALGVISDQDIIKKCLLDLDKNESMVDLFIPSVHDANKIFTQKLALEFIAELTKRGTISGVIEILSDYFLPHIGELNFLEKAYFIGYMVNRLLKVYTKEEKPTDRDNFRFKRIELSGTLIYDLFREYYLIQKKDISRKIDEEYYYHKGSYKEDDTLSRKEKQNLKKKVQNKETQGENKYKNNFIGLIESNVKSFFKDKIVEQGFRKAFKGNWGSEAHTKRLGAVQDLNRLSWYTFISHLRKINLPLDSSAKVVGPRLLNSSQWGFIDPIDTPDGGNIGLHKHLSISAYVTSGTSGFPIIRWMRSNTPLRLVLECSPEQIANSSKVFVNGSWVGIIDTPFELINLLKLYRRNGILPVYTSLSFDIEHNEVYIYTDAGRLTRPIYYIENNKISYDRREIIDLFDTGTISWEQIISGFMEKSDERFNTKNNKIYELHELYKGIGNAKEEVFNKLVKNRSVVDYVDTAEEETALIAVTNEDLKKNRFYTHMEIDPSLILGVMGNLVIYPENNPLPRNSFSCGQSKQAVSVYHSNYQMRIDKMGVILNYGQTPLVKSRYLEYINNEEQPYGVNAIVAIMAYTGYNVEDAILINEGSILRGLFRTTYFSMYEAREESSKVSGMNNSKFANVEKNNVIGKKKGYDYSFLDDHGLIKENTELNDKLILIGKINANLINKDAWIDDSVKPKKGQLGYVDKSFITLGEEGFNIAKVRLREERIPAIGDKMACVLPTQQVLTDEGWIEIQNIDITKHKVATLDINGNMCYEYPVNKFIYEHKGKMYSVSNKQVEVVCTLNHKLYVKQRQYNNVNKEYELIAAQNIIGKMVRFQKSMKNVYDNVEWMELGDKKYKMDDWLQLLGMFISDGSVNNRAVILSAHKQRKVDFNTDILTKLGIEFYHDNYNGYFAINIGKYKELYYELKKYSLGALNKYLPEYVWNLSQRQCIILLEALMEGDGHTYSDGFSRYGTISLRLANDICRLALHCGWSGITKISAQPGDNKHIITGTKGYNAGKSHIIESKNTYYKISIIRKQNQPYINKKVNETNKEELIDYEGNVYCIEMSSSHLYYMRENNYAPSMLIGNSRAGQKGTIGLIIPEADMPYLDDGLRPDLIINPHALPSRMTIGQIVESLLGIACLSYGGFGDCTAFQVKGSNYTTYGPMLTKAGFNHTGNHILYNGMTGEQIQANIYMGPTYYMRLKHMVKDKINYRARGPNQQLTRQPVQGRANDGGLRVGEMERDAICAHGLAYFLNESFLVRGDEYYMAICNKTGFISIYNEEKNLFLSPYADGPINFSTNPDGSMNIKNLSRFGRSFSLLRIPYSFKLLIQELQVMNINMKIITDENVDQLMSMSYSNNICKLLDKDCEKNKEQMEKIIKEYVNEVSMKSRIEHTQNDRQKELNVLKDDENVSLITVNNYQDAFAIISKCLSNITFNNVHINSENGLTNSELPSQINTGPWGFDFDSAHRTLDLIFTQLHHNCYLLCISNGKPSLIKLEPPGIPDFFQQQIQEFKEKNPQLAMKLGSDIRIMQCIIKERKDSFATEFNAWIKSIPYSLPDGAYILDLTDAVMLRDDNKPYWEAYSGKEHMSNYLPILGYSGAKNFYDIPIPNFDDIEVVMDRYKSLPKNKYDWDEKVPKAVFRGNPTGCGTDSETNMRIRLAEMMNNNSTYLDVGLIKTTNNMPRFDPVKGLNFINVNAKPVDRIDMEEQSKYKYIIHIDGNVAAYRLLKTMLLGSVILKVEGKYLLWIEQLLEDGVNYISIKPDMSDLIEKIEWCNSHDAECKIIAENGVKLAQNVLNKDFIDNSFVKILLDVKNKITSRKNTPVSPDFPPPPGMYKPPSPDFPPPPGMYKPPSPDFPAPKADSSSSILEVPKEDESNVDESQKKKEDESSSEENKKVIQLEPESTSEVSNSSQTKKINI